MVSRYVTTMVNELVPSSPLPSLESICTLFKDDAKYPNIPKWKTSPQTLEHLLQHVEALKFPSLSPALSLISPCVLRCLDDHEVSPRLTGLKLLLHLLNQLEPHVLLRTNLDEVYLKAVLHCLEFSFSLPHTPLFYMSTKVYLELLPISHGHTLTESYYEALLTLMDYLLNFFLKMDFKVESKDYCALLETLLSICQTKLHFLSLRFSQRIVHAFCRPLLTFPLKTKDDTGSHRAEATGSQREMDDVMSQLLAPLCVSSLLHLFPLLRPRLKPSAPELILSLCCLVSNGIEHPEIFELKNLVLPLLTTHDCAFIKNQCHLNPKLIEFLT